MVEPGIFILHLCQFILDLIRCRDWYGSDDECVLDRDEICYIIKFLAAG